MSKRGDESILPELSTRDLQRWCEEHHAAYATEDEHCPACWRLGASAAGIPRSVIEGRTKLSDHFSQDYIDEQCGRKGRTG